MHRFYADSGRESGETVFLSPEDSRHAATVLRLKPGSRVELICGGARWEAEIAGSDPHSLPVRLMAPLPSTEPRLKITLFQGLPKADKMDWIVQKATELGVSQIIPVIMKRCMVHPDAATLSRKQDRWQKIAREAGKQSGRCVIPHIAAPLALSQLSGLSSLPERNIVPWEEASSDGPLAFHTTHPELSSLGILIGPEGGIDPEEIRFLEALCFQPVTLGKRILRTETAGLAAVAVLMSLYGEMD